MVDWKSTLPFVIPAQAGIQAFWPCRTSEDGCRPSPAWQILISREDEGISTIPEGDISPGDLEAATNV